MDLQARRTSESRCTAQNGVVWHSETQIHQERFALFTLGNLLNVRPLNLPGTLRRE
jgi:hypothetical protein